MDRLLTNARTKLDEQERTNLISDLSGQRVTRAAVLLNLVEDSRFAEKENERSLVLLHYFSYLHRSPGDPPDHDLNGFNFWIQDLAKNHNPAALSRAFLDSIEYRRRNEGPKD